MRGFIRTLGGLKYGMFKAREVSCRRACRSSPAEARYHGFALSEPPLIRVNRASIHRPSYGGMMVLGVSPGRRMSLSTGAGVFEEL